LGGSISGLYGTLTLNTDGSYTYEVDNDNEQVQALRTAGNMLLDVFTYEISDGTLNDQAELRIRILGQNDAPVAEDDAGVAVEAGGTNNTTGGRAAVGNVLANDSDVDSPDYGETWTVAGARSGAESAGAVPDSMGSAM